MYDFDKMTDRRNTGSLKWDVAEGELPMWVADMDFETAPGILEAIRERTDHGIFGYHVVFIGNYRHMMPDTQLPDSGQSIPVPYFSYRVVGITQDHQGSLRFGQLLFQILVPCRQQAAGACFYKRASAGNQGSAFPCNISALVGGLSRIFRPLFSMELENILYTGVCISTFSPGVVSFRTVLEMMGITPVEKSSHSFSSSK